MTRAKLTGLPSVSFRRRKIARAAATSALAVGAVLAIAACGSSSSGSATSSNVNKSAASYGTVLYGSLPPAGTPTSGGTLTFGQISGQQPTFIFPIAPGANTSTGTISLLANLFIPLYAGPDGARPQVAQGLSAADPPVFTNDDKTVSITVKPGLKWSNGAPVDANDVAFEYYLLKAAIAESPANWGQFSPNVFPLNVTSVKVTSPQTVVFNLNSSVNPGWFLNNNLQTTNNVFPLPSTAWNIAATGGPHLDFTNAANAKAIYNYLAKQGASVSTFGTNPLWQDVDGPFKLKSFSATNGSYVLVPNPTYGLSPKPMMSAVDVNSFTSTTAELNALKSGSLDVGGIDPSTLPQVPVLKSEGITVYGGPGWGWFGAIINFKDTTNDFDKVIAQLYVRQAIAHLINTPQIIAGAYKGAAVPAYGPIPSAPTSPYTTSSATTNPFPFSPSTAVSMLKAHGWKVVPGGQTTCEKAGTAADECGAGIPAGTPISFVWANLPESASTTGALESEAIASEAKSAAGITISLTTKTFNFLTANYNNQNPAATKYTNDWGVNNYGGIYQDYYPTQEGIQSPVNAGFNLGSYDDPTADKLVQASITSSNPDAVEAEAAYWSTHLPVWYMPNPDQLFGVSNKIGGTPNGFLAYTQQQFYYQYFYAVK